MPSVVFSAFSLHAQLSSLLLSHHFPLFFALSSSTLIYIFLLSRALFFHQRTAPLVHIPRTTVMDITLQYAIAAGGILSLFFIANFLRLAQPLCQHVSRASSKHLF